MKIICTVTNDLTYDQRMHRICSSLVEAGHDVLLVGRNRRNSKKPERQKFRQKRLWCVFDKGKLFYIEYNVRLWLFLLFAKTDVYCAVDLDTILANLVVAKLKGKKLGYDAHEYFTEMEEVVRRPLIKKMWKAIERYAVPKVDFAYTISGSYKSLFENEYNKKFEVIRNVAMLKPLPEIDWDQRFAEKTVLYQGAVNEGRGLEKLVSAMKGVGGKLIICGEGDIYEALENQVASQNLQDKVELKGYIAPEALFQVTTQATVGITLFTKAGLSNKYSLANRFFDYFHAGVPQLAVNYPEYEKFNKALEVALLIDEVTEENIRSGLQKLLSDREFYQKLHENCLKAREIHNWQAEGKKLVGIYDNL